MAVYMVTYDLHSPGQNYRDLINRIKEYQHCKATESCFLIDVRWSAGEVRDDLKRFVDSNDTLFVAKLSGSWSSWCLNTVCVEWLKSSARSW